MRGPLAFRICCLSRCWLDDFLLSTPHHPPDQKARKKEKEKRRTESKGMRDGGQFGPADTTGFSTANNLISFSNFYPSTLLFTGTTVVFGNIWAFGVRWLLPSDGTGKGFITCAARPTTK